ncbi:MAG: LytTR family DNA-binding domain-containing protein [Ferruginibacter sp.]
MRILIIEDEQNATERLEKLVNEVAPEKQIIGKCKSIRQTFQWLHENGYPDLILSDVQLSDGLSFEIFQQLEKKVPVIFISAYDTYAIEAFKAEGLHYLLKPVKKQELKEAIQRYDQNYHEKKKQAAERQNEPGIVSVQKQYQERFIIHVGSQIKLIQDHEIAYLYTENKTVYIVTFDKQKYSMDITLESFEKTLNPNLFYRINRQFVVQLKAITKMVPASKQRIELSLEPPTSYETITSFERTPNFKKWLLGEI